jgi:cell division protein FtsL
MLLAEQQARITPIDTTVPSQRLHNCPRPKYRFVYRIGGAIFGVLVVNLFLHAAVIQKSYEIRIWEEKIRDLNREMVEVRMDIAHLESFDRIKTIAENELGMKPAGTDDYRCIAVAPPSAESRVGGDYQLKDKSSLWIRVASWIGNQGATMAQDP